MREKSVLRLLFFIREEFPTYRPDVSVLFGKYLPKVGVLSDLVARRGAKTLQLSEQWPAGKTLIVERRTGRIANQLYGILHDVRILLGLSRGQYDAVQVRDKVFAATLALWIAHRRGIRFFYWMSFPINESAIWVARAHGLSLGAARYAYMMLRGHIGKFLLYRVVAPRADFVFVQSEKMRRDIAARGIPIERTMAVPMCVDPERFPENPSAPITESFAGREVVAYLGTCERMRRIEFLLDVVATLKKTHPNILLLLIGNAIEEEDRTRLRNQVKQRGCEQHVLITGWLNPTEAQAYLASARLAYALMAPDPILDSTTPTKLVEYMAMSKAVVANEHPDQSLLLTESQGGYCVPFDVQSFVAATIKLLDDPARAIEMGARGRSYVLRHRSYPIMAQRLAEAYRSLLAH